MSLINTLENKFGRFAIPGLVNLVACGQLLAWVAIKIYPDALGQLLLFKPAVMQGEVWRLVSFIFIPPAWQPIWVVLGLMVMFMIGSALDRAWGPFRVNLFIIGTIVFAATAILMQQSHLERTILRIESDSISITGKNVTGPAWLSELGLGCSIWLDASLFLAFACIAPDVEFLAFFILPIKAKYLAMLSGAGLALDFLDKPWVRIPMFFTLLPFFIAFGPPLIRFFKHRGKVVQRRARFEAAAQPEGDSFHRCASCKKTEHDDPKLEFRVTADGEEYCNVCRPKKT
jgi:hypothetical protein